MSNVYMRRLNPSKGFAMKRQLSIWPRERRSLVAVMRFVVQTLPPLDSLSSQSRKPSQLINPRLQAGGFAGASNGIRLNAPAGRTMKSNVMRNQTPRLQSGVGSRPHGDIEKLRFA